MSHTEEQFFRGVTTGDGRYKVQVDCCCFRDCLRMSR